MAEACRGCSAFLLPQIHLWDAFHYSVKQGRMVERVPGGVSGELSLLCDFEQIYGATHVGQFPVS